MLWGRDFEILNEPWLEAAGAPRPMDSPMARHTLRRWSRCAETPVFGLAAEPFALGRGTVEATRKMDRAWNSGSLAPCWRFCSWSQAR
jgi:hypothetical protein